MSSESRRADIRDPSVIRTLPKTVVQSDIAELPAVDECECNIKSSDFDHCQIAGRYHLGGEIARGGMGIVIKAFDELLHRDVAVKVLLHKYRNQPVLYESFINEALLTSRLQHPAIVPVYDFGLVEDQSPFFVMKLITGQSLAELLTTEPDHSQTLKSFEQVCQAIAYAHSQGILHLDLKPSNIMIGQFGEVHVMDWGLARYWNSSPETSPAFEGSISRSAIENELGANYDSGAVRGTPAYMSPEQARGEVVCPRSDIFGLGALLCEILTGKPPYQGPNQKRVLAHSMQTKVDDAFRRLDSCGRDDHLVNLTKRCLSKAKSDRPESAKTVALAIGNYLEFALKQAESDICRFFDLTLDLFCIATLDGYFTRVNINFTRVLGYPESTLVSQPFLNFVHPEDIESTKEAMKNLLLGMPVVRFCNRYRHADGHCVPLEWTARSIPEEGSVFAVARDVTHSLFNAAAKN